MAFQVESLKNELTSFSEHLKNELSPSLEEDRALIEDGFQLYKKRPVYDIQGNDEFISCVVLDPSPERVRLDLDFPTFSTCTCGRNHWCSHQIAAFFSVLKEMYPVSMWLEEWKETTSPQAKKKKPIEIPGVSYARDLLNASIRAGDDGPENWGKRVEVAYQTLNWDYVRKNPYILESQIQKLHHQLMKKSPIEQEWRPLYQLFISLHLFLLTTKDCEQASESSQHLHNVSSSALFFLIEEGDEALAQLSSCAAPFAFDRYIQALKGECQKLIDGNSTETNYLFKRIEFYRMIWTDFFKREQWRKTELKRLESKVQSNDFLGTLAYMHQLFLLNKLDKFAELAYSLPSVFLQFFNFWIHYALVQKKYEHASILIEIISEKVQDFLRSLDDEYEKGRFARWLIHAVDQDWISNHQPELYEKLLTAMLPYSFYSLNQHLLVSQQLKKWAELQLWAELELSELEHMGLKEVTKISPELVLPIYIHGIQFLLDQRNRDSYKKCVKYLKKVRTIYRKMKKLDHWNHYFDFILQNTKRLRAFHEECRKGKLLDE
ncbi:hypothetical protein J2S13_000504 [Oikeobacillus pervagus]|uniref:SWIM-type domain-containing protein n=1 Tax=Oikeobacillus pervagus TaxID=1325931 RepID=A0AAJ1WI93_9BACI|nr:hypothetical protein [Oikeobacillus pervagus]MDQ0214108.1 hypothetical protein [Oikeobacillus pervagus]